MNSLVKPVRKRLLAVSADDIGRSEESKDAPRHSMTKSDALFEKPFSVN